MTRLVVMIVSLLSVFGVVFATPAAASETDHFQAAVDEFARSIGMPQAVWVNIPSGKYVMTSFGPAASITSLFYDPIEEKVYIGEDALRKLTNKSHWVTPGIVRAHEWGHFLWDRAGVLRPVQASEDGADCIAGAWLAWYNQRLPQDLRIGLADMPGLASLLGMISRNERSPEGDIHGTFQDRSLAMINGFLHGIGSCDHYKQFV